MDQYHEKRPLLTPQFIAQFSFYRTKIANTWEWTTNNSNVKRILCTSGYKTLSNFVGNSDKLKINIF